MFVGGDGVGLGLGLLGGRLVGMLRLGGCVSTMR